MTDLKKAAQQALAAWEHINKYGFVLADYEGPMEQAITALKAALEQPEQEQAEPVAYAYHPCTFILIEALKESPNGKEVLAKWDEARAKVDTLRAALEQPARPLCKGIPRRGCNYLAPCDTVCNKCGEIHHHHQMVAQFQAAIVRAEGKV
jgi:hypothetical protein